MFDDQLQEGATKPPPSPEEIERYKATPGFNEILKTIRRWDEYDDFSSGFLDKFPNNLPGRLPLKLGNKSLLILSGSVPIRRFPHSVYKLNDD
jgi:hypothetical protein